MHTSDSYTYSLKSCVSVDHTYGTNYGKYIQAEGDGQNGDEFGTAVLESQTLEQVNSEGDCLQFWYYLHEKNSSDGTNILVNMFQEGSDERIELKKLSGDHGEVWRLDRTPVKSDKKYKVGDCQNIIALSLSFKLCLAPNCR